MIRKIICNFTIFNFVFLVLFTNSLCSDIYDNEFPHNLESIESQNPSLATLKFVGIVSRHGSRAPFHTYPNDPYPYTDRRFWPQGKAELTNYGKQQLYQTGKRLRERYDGYLPSTYYPNDTIAVHNPANRDFDSLSCLLASLYPPQGQEVWNNYLMWQPIPSTVYNFDVCELIHNNECPEYVVEALKSAAAYGLKVLSNTTCMLKYISNHTGQTFLSVVQLYVVTDALMMQEENGFKLPEWTKSVYPDELKSYWVHTLNALYAGSDKILSFTAGPELEHIAGLLNKKVNQTLPKNTKLYIEMAHDCTIYALLKAMGSPEGEKLVQTSAYLTFELHQLYTSYIVQVLYYRNYKDEDPVFINIERCPSPCSLENFNKFVRTVTGPVSWETACKKISLF